MRKRRIQEMEELAMTIGEIIKNAKTEYRLTQEELASKMMVSRQAITKWESGKGIPNVSNLKLLAQLLNISVNSQ